MAYTITISTNAQFVNDTDQLQLVMVFTVNDLTAANESYSAITKGIRVEDWGKLQWKYDIEDALLVPSSLGMVLTDAEGYLSSLFFGTSEANIKTDKRAQIQLWMNGALKFQGKIIEDSISYNDAYLRLEFTAATDMDIINQAMLYNLDNSPVDPFKYNPALKYAVWGILEDIFKLASPDISYSGGTLEIHHGWDFRGQNRTTPYDWVSDFKLTDLFLDVTPLFYDSSRGISTVGDLLRKMALDFCCFTGLVSANRAVFRQLFYYDSADLQELGTVINRTKGYQYGLLDYVKSTVKAGSTTLVYEEGTFTKVKNRYMEREVLAYFWHNTNQYGYAESGTTVEASKDGEAWYNIWGSRDMDLDTWFYDFGKIVAMEWHHYRSSMQNCRLDKVEVMGINYDPIKNFPYAGCKYQPIGLTVYLSKNKSEFDVIYLGEV
jgi:hypothetical protein